ncbi:MAG TPA: hypothetical protein VKD72_03925 [Gemmataceae bacterium]|nr:hypothetical protein [Gemmataceae bacterium]
MPDEDDPFKEPRAYNYSIYLMVGMPYLLLGTVGFLVYRGLKQKARAEQLSAGPAPAGGEGDRPCSDLSHVEDLLPAP